MISRRFLLLMLVLSLTAIGCGSDRPVAEQTIYAFVRAVQEEDLDTLACMLAGAGEGKRESFDLWAETRYEAYLTGRDLGFIELGDDGIALTKALTLGKGTYYTLRAVDRVGDATLVVDAEVRLAYGDIALAGLPAGTTFYLCGVPMGTIIPARIPHGAGAVNHEVVETVVVRFTLARDPEGDGCPSPTGWAVAGVEPMAGSVTTREITWIF